LLDARRFVPVMGKGINRRGALKGQTMFSLTTTHLRFICEATTPLRLEADTFRAGSNLRGALGQVMTRAYCAEPHPFAPPLLGEGMGERSHVAGCPVHWLLAANEKPGQERRGYALVPPLHGARADGKPGDSFEFGLTLFGSTLQFLPYFILAIPEMGRLGIGPGRGKFRLQRVWALNPLTGESEALLSEGSNLVHTPTLLLDQAQVEAAAARLLRELQVEIHFLTPMRLIDEGKIAKTPDFEVFFARLLKRLDELNEQHGNGSARPREEVEALHDLAARVQLVEVQTRWVEVWSGSTRRGQPSPLSGFVGRAVYAASGEVWRTLLPWLVWGQLVQVGKDTVKGNGVIELGAVGD
jgi:CRISPR-associated endoribonuclease Cas6